MISIIFCLTILYGIEKREHLITAQSSALVSPEQIAYELYKSGSYEKALEEFDKLLRTESANRDLWLFRGFTHEKMNNYAAALSDMLHVTKLDQDYFLAYQHVDWLYAREGRWQDIVNMWDKYLARHPYSGEAFLERAGTYKHKGDVQASQADLEKACNYKSAEACRILQRNH